MHDRNAVECVDEVASFCCPIVVASMGSPATTKYLAALAAYKKQCPQVCPLIACRIGPGTCVKVTGGSKSDGTCVRRVGPLPPL